MNRIDAAFEGAAGRPLIVPFVTVGYPTLDSTPGLVASMAQAGADIIELGLPFSDPLADGPTIQRSSEVALANGVTLGSVLDTVRLVRADPSTAEIPLVLMGYCNPMLRYGLERFVADAGAVGVDGLIVPDVPLEEAAELRAACSEHGLAPTFLMAPNTPGERIRLTDEASESFSYCVSVTGVTGARGSVQDRTVEFLQRVRAIARKPFVVGFGVKEASHVRSLGALADGVVVGSALIDTIDAGDDPAAAVGSMVRELRAAAEETAQADRHQRGTT